MSRKSDKIARLLDGLPDGGPVDPHYAGFFHCFNRGLYYEAHDVLEQLWLQCRGQRDDLFYKGLIQLAGAFVHLQKDRLGPAGALFKLAQGNLRRFPERHQHLDLTALLGLIERWLSALGDAGPERNPLRESPAPKLELTLPNDA